MLFLCVLDKIHFELRSDPSRLCGVFEVMMTGDS